MGAFKTEECCKIVCLKYVVGKIASNCGNIPAKAKKGQNTVILCLVI